MPGREIGPCWRATSTERFQEIASVELFDLLILLPVKRFRRDDQPDQQPQSVFSHVYASLGQRLGKRTFEQVRDAERISPGFTWAKLVAGLIAFVVHGLTVGFLVLGLWMAVVLHRSPGYIVIGIFLLLVAWELRPRLGKPPKRVVGRQKMPATYDLLDRVSKALGARPIDGITVTPDFNAAIVTVGWRRRSYIALGLPLLAILDPQERVAIFGHEIGHRVNHDPRRGAFIGTSLHTLQTWYYLLSPQRLRRPRPSYRGDTGYLIGVLINAVQGPIAWFIKRVWTLMIHLIWQSNQRAEYLADNLAARVAGSDAAVSALRKLGLQSVFRQVVQSSTLNAPGEGGLVEDFRRQVAAYPHADLERLLSKQIDAGFRLDATHPPNAYRIEFLRAHPAPAELTLSHGGSDRIDEEFRGFERSIQERLVESYRASLYRGNR